MAARSHVWACRVALCLIVAIGLALRLAGAQGGLWVDEAWSAVLVHRVHGAAGVFLSINHDNNHHLNSLWIQAIQMMIIVVIDRQ